jgi:hypothetical protein
MARKLHTSQQVKAGLCIQWHVQNHLPQSHTIMRHAIERCFPSVLITSAIERGIASSLTGGWLSVLYALSPIVHATPFDERVDLAILWPTVMYEKRTSVL